MDEQRNPTRTPTDPEAQLSGFGAQDGGIPMTHEADILLRVLARHRVAQGRLAKAANVSDGHLSRMLSGAHPVTLAVIRAALAMTMDPELLGAIDHDSYALVAVPRPALPRDRHAAYLASIRATHDAALAAADLFRAVPAAGAADRVAAACDAAIAALAALKHTVTADRQEAA
jgi:hypothetical protein